MKKPEIKSDLARIDRMKDSDIDYSDIPPLDYLRYIGKKGGQSKSAKKVEASAKNLEKARTVRNQKGNKDRTD